MTKIIQILKSFSDKELSYFYKYRSKQYTAKTLQEIECFIFKEKELNIENIQRLTKDKITKDGRCPRCGSNKNFSYLVDYYPKTIKKLSRYFKEDFSSNIVKKPQIECSICGYIIENPSKCNILRRLFCLML